MIKSDTTSGHIKVCSNAYHEALTLYNECKDKSFIDSRNVIVSMPDVYHRYDIVNKNKTDNNSQKIGKSLCVYTLYSNGYTEKEMEEMHQTGISPARAIEKYYQKRPIAPMRLNQQIRRIWDHFDHTKPIRHASVTIKGMDISKPDDCQEACMKALAHSGIGSYVIFGMDRGDNGIYHFHIAFQGSFRRYNHVLERTGMSYHVFKDEKPRNEYIDIIELTEEGSMHKDRIIGFHATMKYNLEMHHPNSRNYIKVSR